MLQRTNTAASQWYHSGIWWDMLHGGLYRLARKATHFYDRPNREMVAVNCESGGFTVWVYTVVEGYFPFVQHTPKKPCCSIETCASSWQVV